MAGILSHEEGEPEAGEKTDTFDIFNVFGNPTVFALAILFLSLDVGHHTVSNLLPCFLHSATSPLPFSSLDRVPE